MKRIVNILLILMSSVVYTAQAENTDVHLKQLVKCINDSDFVCATEQLPLVEDWSFFSSDKRLWLDVKNTFDALIYADSISVPKCLQDSLVIFLSCEIYAYALYYYEKNKPKAALSYWHLYSRLKRKVFGQYNMEYSASVLTLAVCYNELNDYQTAEQYYLQVQEIYDMNDVLEHTPEKYAALLNELGNVYLHRGDYSKAEDYYLRALNIRKNSPGISQVEYAGSLVNVSMVSQMKGNFSSAIQYLLEALQIYDTSISHEDSRYTCCLDHLGDVYSDMGDMEKAEKYYLQSYTIRKNTLGERDPGYAISLNNLGTYEFSIGNYEKALKYLSAALRISQSNSHDSIQYAKIICNIGSANMRLKNYRKAEEDFMHVLSIYNHTYDTENLYYADVYNQLANLYDNEGDFSQAEKYYLQAASIRKNTLGETHPEYALSLYNLGALYLTMHDRQRAEEYFSRSYAIRESTLGENHPRFRESSLALGVLYTEKKEYPQAEPFLISSFLKGKKKYISYVRFLSEYQRMSYWNITQADYLQMYPYFAYRYYHENKSISTFAYDNELFVKGLLLSSANAIKNSVLASGDTTLIRQWNELTEKKQQIIALEEKDPQSDYLTQVKEEAESLEKEITRKSAAYRENMRQWAITWDSVRASLKPNQVAIEYMRAPLNEDSTMYCALLLRDTCSYPIMIPLFEEKEVSALLHQSTANKENINPTYTYDKNGKQLSQHIWSRVMPYLNEGETVFFSPTGILHQIAIENLPFTESNTMGDRYNLVRLSSTRELAMTGQAIPHQTATLYGGILYDPMDTTIMIANATRYRSLESTAQHTSSTDTIQRSMALYLPGSKAEIDSIQPILAKKKIAVTVYSKDTACEESFKAQSGKRPNILLLSTHGFFWKDSTARQERYFRQRAIMQGEDDFRTVTSIDPLERCGLLFAGANTALSGHSDRLPQGVDDGILTAKEISVLDFRKTDIVVMSACETGLGDISGEGVFGLQRAFKMAGAKTIMMTLWQVNDRATNLFMTSFFRHYSQGMSKRQAFRLAQQEVRNYTGEGSSDDSKALMSGKERMQSKSNLTSHQPSEVSGQKSEVSGQKSDVSHPYASPYYWAGFILLD